MTVIPAAVLAAVAAAATATVLASLARSPSRAPLCNLLRLTGRGALAFVYFAHIIASRNGGAALLEYVL